jgi:hypothetical protein
MIPFESSHPLYFEFILGAMNQFIFQIDSNDI